MHEIERITKLKPKKTGISQTEVEKIISKLPEASRASLAFGRKNSQVSSKLMTLSMMARSPYRVLRQCLAQIETKRQALKEAYFRMKKDKIKAEMKREKAYTDPHIAATAEQELAQVEAEELEAGIADSELYIQGALKEIASFQAAYDQVCKTHNIPKNWDEKDFEKSEVAHHLRTAFFNAYRDVMQTGRLGMGTMEYLDQFGVHPATAHDLVFQYMESIEKLKGNGQMPTTSHLDKFLDEMAERFKDCHQDAMRRLGLETLINEQFLFLDHNDKHNDSGPEFRSHNVRDSE